MPHSKYIMSKMKKSISTRGTGARSITWMILLMKNLPKAGNRTKKASFEFLLCMLNFIELYNYIQK